MAFSKIDGFEVTPRRPSSAISLASPPLFKRSRLTKSSQTDCPYSFSDQSLIDIDAESHFASRTHQDDVWPAALGIGENIGATSHSGGRRVARAVESRQVLPAQNQAGWLVPKPQSDAPRLGHLVRI